jgi:hypothetical protein
MLRDLLKKPDILGDELGFVSSMDRLGFDRALTRDDFSPRILLGSEELLLARVDVQAPPSDASPSRVTPGMQPMLAKDRIRTIRSRRSTAGALVNFFAIQKSLLIPGALRSVTSHERRASQATPRRRRRMEARR